MSSYQENTFEIATTSISIGDPVMGMMQHTTDLPKGHYTLDVGALVSPDNNEMDVSDGAIIELDGPYIFVVDSSREEAFEDKFHEMMDEYGHVLTELIDRLQEFDEHLSVKVGFFWENELVGSAREGNYQLDPSKLCRVN